MFFCREIKIIAFTKHKHESCLIRLFIIIILKACGQETLASVRSLRYSQAWNNEALLEPLMTQCRTITATRVYWAFCQLGHPGVLREPTSYFWTGVGRVSMRNITSTASRFNQTPPRTLRGVVLADIMFDAICRRSGRLMLCEPPSFQGYLSQPTVDYEVNL